jgi:uncharacterized membrane protein HdeD (DUF308 family)
MHPFSAISLAISLLLLAGFVLRDPITVTDGYIALAGIVWVVTAVILVVEAFTGDLRIRLRRRTN